MILDEYALDRQIGEERIPGSIRTVCVNSDRKKWEPVKKQYALLLEEGHKMFETRVEAETWRMLCGLEEPIQDVHAKRLKEIVRKIK